METYTIHRATLPWDPGGTAADGAAAFWAGAQEAAVGQFPWYTGGEKWQAVAQLLYDDQRLYARMVSRGDHHIVAAHTQPNQSVYMDSCGEFFLQPGADPALGYFNVEINCVGTMLMAHGHQRHGRVFLRPELTEQVIIWTSVPGPVKHASPDDDAWEIQVAIPYAVLRAHVAFPTPAPGSEWRGNFYRCAEGTPNPQYSCWSPIGTDAPDYHRPEYFGRLLFA